MDERSRLIGSVYWMIIGLVILVVSNQQVSYGQERGCVGICISIQTGNNGGFIAIDLLILLGGIILIVASYTAGQTILKARYLKENK